MNYVKSHKIIKHGYFWGEGNKIIR